ncbi:MAG TPA: family 1 glycosylhydrolase [Opitutaceae bacterium]|nr:family 1 glycosylhydrolase [Opitutaceae bacterium]
MTLLRQSLLPRLRAPSTFLWATGIEDTFITAPWPKTGRTLDEYELTGHYERWHEDLGLIRELGASTARYGLPWHRINPRPGVWVWDFADRTIDRLLELGIEPIVDLVHYGLPPWIDGAYRHPDFPAFMAEYAGRVAARLRGRAFAYTPLNEPRITAWYCGRLGWWPPFLRGWRGFVAVMLAVCRGIVRTVQALRSEDPEIVIAHVDATDLYRTDIAELEPDAAHRQDLVFLALDLISGRIVARHPLAAWLIRQGAGEPDLEWFRDHAVDLPLIGINLYPMFTLKTARRSQSGGVRWTMPYAGAEILVELGTRYWERYQAPIFGAETASVGSIPRRRRWLTDSIEAVRQLRTTGIPIVGYTWWPLFALVTWAYRQGTHAPDYYLKQMGLWDLDPALRRLRTPLVDEFAAYAQRGTSAVGALNSAGNPPPDATR